MNRLIMSWFSYSSAAHGGTGFSGGYGSSSFGGGSAGGGGSSSSSSAPYRAMAQGQWGVYNPSTGIFTGDDGSSMSIGSSRVTSVAESALPGAFSFGGGKKTPTPTPPEQSQKTHVFQPVQPKQRTPTQQQKFAEYTAGLVSKAGSPAMATSLSGKYGLGTNYQAVQREKDESIQAMRKSTGDKYYLTREEYLAMTRSPGGVSGDVLVDMGKERQSLRKWATSFVGQTPPGYKPVIKQDASGGLIGEYQFVKYELGTPVVVGKGKPSGYTVVGGLAGEGKSVQTLKEAEKLAGAPSVSITGELLSEAGWITPVFAQTEVVTVRELIARSRREAREKGFRAEVHLKKGALSMSYVPLEYYSSEFKALSPEAKRVVKQARVIQSAESPRDYATLIGVKPEPVSKVVAFLRGQPVGVQLEASKYLGVPTNKPVPSLVVEEYDFPLTGKRGVISYDPREGTPAALLDLQGAEAFRERETFRAEQPWIAEFRKLLRRTEKGKAFVTESQGYVGANPWVGGLVDASEFIVGSVQDMVIFSDKALYAPLDLVYPNAPPRVAFATKKDYGLGKYVSGAFNIAVICGSADAGNFSA